MRIDLKGRPKQGFGFRVVCLDTIMLEMLNSYPDLPAPYIIKNIDFARQNQYMVLFTFSHGAFLTAGPFANEYIITPQRLDGSDGLAAISELKMLDALRTARKHYYDAKKACYDPKLETTTLRVTKY